MRSVGQGILFSLLTLVAGCGVATKPAGDAVQHGEPEILRERVRLFYQAFQEHKPDLLDQVLADDWVDVPLAPGQGPGLAGMKPIVGEFAKVFPDLESTIEDIVVEGNKVVVRSTMRGTHKARFGPAEPKGRKVEIMAIDVHEFKDGKIAKSWHVEDWMTGLFQMGAFESTTPKDAAAPGEPTGLDRRVSSFLEAQRHRWHDWNVPYGDGKILHDLVVEKRAKRILEIGTSTGHSTIWLAWAAAKTGGKVTTIEIDPERHAAAVENLKKAGVAEYVDARLGDAHELVKTLPGPFDFVFSDADKEWYLQYFLDLTGKVADRGCFTAHNVLRNGGKEVDAFVAKVRSLPSYATTIENGETGEGISVSCRR